PSDPHKPTPRDSTLPPHIFHELAAIWAADRRIPTVDSRRRWAQARRVDPVRVHNWWYRRRRVAHTLGVEIPPEGYELPVGDPREGRTRWEAEAREREAGQAAELKQEEREVSLGHFRPGSKKRRGAPADDASKAPGQKKTRSAPQGRPRETSRKEQTQASREQPVWRDSSGTPSRTDSKKDSLRQAKIKPVPKPHLRRTRRNRPEEWQEWTIEKDGDGANTEMGLSGSSRSHSLSPAPVHLNPRHPGDSAMYDMPFAPQLPALDDSLRYVCCGASGVLSRTTGTQSFVCAVCAEPAPLAVGGKTATFTNYDFHSSLDLFFPMLDSPTPCAPLSNPDHRHKASDDSGDDAARSLPCINPLYDSRSIDTLSPCSSCWLDFFPCFDMTWGEDISSLPRMLGPVICYDLTDAAFSAPAFEVPFDDCWSSATELPIDTPPAEEHVYTSAIAMDRYAAFSPIQIDECPPVHLYSPDTADPCKLDPAALHYPHRWSKTPDSRSSSVSDSCTPSPLGYRLEESPGPRRSPTSTTVADSCCPLSAGSSRNSLCVDGLPQSASARRAPLRSIELIDVHVQEIAAPRPRRPSGGVQRLEAEAARQMADPGAVTSGGAPAGSLPPSMRPRMSWLLSAAVDALTASR
ncbi:hypothetical protein HDZ31DRAFT_29940, partial [Schizophyllum fasciatum]